MAAHNDYVDALRLSDEQQAAIIDELEVASHDVPEAKLRKSERHRYVVREGILVQLENSATQFVVRPRNISAGGLSFLHGSFIYNGTHCRVTLKTVDGEKVLASGIVRRCRCVHGRVHEVGLQFTNPIEVENFVVGIRKPVSAAESTNDHDYIATDVVELAQQLQELALDQVPRDQLYRKLAELVALLRR